MKKYYILILLCTLLLLAGCKSKSSFWVTFDEFTFKFYDNKKVYTEIQPETSDIGLQVIKELKEDVAEGDTGFINSLIVIRSPIQSGVDIEELVESNTKNLQLKLLKYASQKNEAKKVKCDDMQYSGYITAFSYQVGKETLYGGQYFFLDEELLYIVSLSSDKSSDIDSFITSVKTMKCIN